MLESPRPILVADLFPEILGHLVRLLESLAQEDWSKPTVCPGWSVKDVALHLLGVELGNLSRRRDGHSLGGAISGWGELVSLINQWNQEWVRVSRRISAPLLIDLLNHTGAQMCEHFFSLDPHAIGGAVSWAGPDPKPVWLDIAREYTERWHHQQHIRDAVDLPGLKQPKYLAPVLSTFARALPQAFRSSEAPEGTIASLAISGDSGGRWSVRREEEAWRLYQGSPEIPEAEVGLHEDIAWRLFTRGISKEQTQAKAITTGNRQLGDRILEMVSIIA